MQTSSSFFNCSGLYTIAVCIVLSRGLQYYYRNGSLNKTICQNDCWSMYARYMSWESIASADQLFSFLQWTVRLEKSQVATERQIFVYGFVQRFNTAMLRDSLCRVGRSASSTHFPYPSSLPLPPFPTFPLSKLYCWRLRNSPWPFVGNPRKRTKVT